jgi:hypothetical protein
VRRSTWQANAECVTRRIDPELFFPEVGQGVDPAVLSACSACPVRTQCLRTAMRDEAALGPLDGRIRRYGIRGGLTARQRTHVAAGRKIRPLVTTATRNRGKRGYQAAKAARAAA